MEIARFLSGEWTDAELLAATGARGVEPGLAALVALRANLALLRERSLTLLAATAADTP